MNNGLHSVLYCMMGVQMLAWLIFSVKAGKLTDKGFLFFTSGMLLGQFGAGIETLLLRAWGAFAVQVFFFAFTAFGAVQRLRMMHRTEAMKGV
jgi:hypothetical protein